MTNRKIDTVYVLRPEPIAEKCFLLEALNWLAFRQIPLAEPTENRKDHRFDSEYNSDYAANFGDDYGLIPSEDCLAVGLPRNPEYDALMEGEYYGDVEQYEKLLAIIDDAEYKKTILQDIEKAREFEKIMADWNEILEAHLELPKAEIYMALRKGQLTGYGKLLPDHDVDKAIEKLNENGDWAWEDLPYQKIPASFWRLDGMDWDASAAHSKDEHFAHIYVDVDELFSIFPIPDAQVKAIKQISGRFMLYEANDKVPTTSAGKRGRPPLKNWHEIQHELTRLLIAGELPDKQTACISLLQEWWARKFKDPAPKTTSLKMVVSDFYQKFKP